MGAGGPSVRGNWGGCPVLWVNLTCGDGRTLASDQLVTGAACPSMRERSAVRVRRGGVTPAAYSRSAGRAPWPAQAVGSEKGFHFLEGLQQLAGGGGIMTVTCQGLDIGRLPGRSVASAGRVSVAAVEMFLELGRIHDGETRPCASRLPVPAKIRVSISPVAALPARPPNGHCAPGLARLGRPGQDRSAEPLRRSVVLVARSGPRPIVRPQQDSEEERTCRAPSTLASSSSQT